MNPIQINYQIPSDDPAVLHPKFKFVDRVTSMVPRVGDMIELSDGREVTVTTVLWLGLDMTRALVILR